MNTLPATVRPAAARPTPVRRRPLATALAALAVGASAGSAAAGSHLWDFWEIFSTDDGSVQFIELHVPLVANGEINMANKKITSLATGKSFTFPVNLAPPSGLKYLLLATQSFADLPGAPTPDFIIPPSFFSPNGDTLKWHTYDTFIFTAAQMPTDCVLSLNRDKTTGVNSPKNYGGATGSVDACPPPPCPADLDGSGAVDGADLGTVLQAWGTAGSIADLNSDGAVDSADLGLLLAAWGDCG